MMLRMIIYDNYDVDDDADDDHDDDNYDYNDDGNDDDNDDDNDYGEYDDVDDDVWWRIHTSLVASSLPNSAIYLLSGWNLV